MTIQRIALTIADKIADPELQVRLAQSFTSQPVLSTVFSALEMFEQVAAQPSANQLQVFAANYLQTQAADHPIRALVQQLDPSTMAPCAILPEVQNFSGPVFSAKPRQPVFEEPSCTSFAYVVPGTGKFDYFTAIEEALAVDLASEILSAGEYAYLHQHLKPGIKLDESGLHDRALTAYEKLEEHYHSHDEPLNATRVIAVIDRHFEKVTDIYEAITAAISSQTSADQLRNFPLPANLIAAHPEGSQLWL